MALTAALDFGRVGRGEVVTRRLRLESRGLMPIQIESIVSRDPRFQPAPALLPFGIAPGQAVEVPVYFADPRGPPAVSSSQIEVTSDDPDLAVQEVLVSAETVEPALLNQAFEIWLKGLEPSSDFDLHVLGPSGAFFDAPDDVCACNPRPEWGTTGDLADDPRFGDDAAGLGAETVRFTTPPFGRLEVWAHHRVGSAPAMVEVGVRVGETSYGREARMLAPGEAAAFLWVNALEGSVRSVVSPPESPAFDDCY